MRDTIVVITRKTALEELVQRFNTREQARFYLEHAGVSFAEYQQAHDTYLTALRQLKEALPKGARVHFIERAFLPNYTFGEMDLVVTLGQDGLVVNTAKYLKEQPLLAINPDPKHIDGVLLPFHLDNAHEALTGALADHLPIRHVVMARAQLNDQQCLYAVNDLFIGQRTHVSARYELRHGKLREMQSSSGIIVATGAGSTGWLRSVLAGAAGVVESFGQQKDAKRLRDSYRFDWEAEELRVAVREPFVSQTSSAKYSYGRLTGRQTLEIVSHMPQNGVIFGDGMETDYLEFNSGAIARIGIADKRLHLVVR